MSTKTAWGLLSLTLVGGAARAEIVHFVNPAPGQPGHYDWYAPLGYARFLDVTVPASEQQDDENGTSIGQGVGGLPTGGTFTVMLGTAAGPGAIFSSAFAVESALAPRTLALLPGESLEGRVYESYGYHTQGSPPSTLSLFPEGERRYVGVRTDGNHYAWIEVERTAASLSAFSWAYETVPGVPILAGVVPAPGAPAVIGLAAGVAGARRTRRPRSHR